MKIGDWKDIAKKLERFRYPALLLAVGVILMMIPFGGQKESAEETETVRNLELFDLNQFTENTEEILSGISGAGKVKVLLTLETDGVREYLTDTTQQIEGERTERQVETVLQRLDGDDLPVSVCVSYPKFRGAVVVCSGGDVPTVILGIKEALSSLTGLGMDKITVLKMN